MYVPPQPAGPVPDTTRVLASTAYPVQRDQHYDTAVSLKIHRLSLMVLYILQFTNNFFCSSMWLRPFTYCRGLDGEPRLDVTPGDLRDVPQDRFHHQEVPCRDELPRQPGSTTTSTVPPVVLQLHLDWSFPRGTIVLVTATLPGSFLPGACHTYFSKENQVQTYMHARINFHAYSWHMWITQTISHKKKGDYQSITLNPGNEGTKLHKQSTEGCVRLAPATSSTRLQSSFLLLSNNVYSKGEHLSYSASVGRVWMQGLYSGLAISI
jgi:hypothetical protein